MGTIWLIIVMLSLALLLFSKPEAALLSMNAAANQAVTLSLKLIAVYSIWMGILKILQATGLNKKIEKLLSPVINLLFGKDINAGAKNNIAINMTANLLGFGGAATPMGINAIEQMQKTNKKKESASTPMIMLLVISACGIQLLPTTVIGMRQAAGSAAAGDIILPAIISTFASVIFGILLVKLCAFVENKLEKRLAPLREAKAAAKAAKATAKAALKSDQAAKKSRQKELKSNG